MKVCRFLSIVVVLQWTWLSVASAEPAQASEEADGGEPKRVAVVSFDRGTEAGALMETVSDLLDRAKYEVVAGTGLEELLAEHQAGEVSDDVASQFAGISNKIGDGVKSFFYKGNETAVEELTPIFDLGMGHPEVLVRRPDFAEQIFQAGIVLVRAHRNLDQTDKAKAVVRQLVRTMPGRAPSPSTAPPNVIRFFEKEQKNITKQGTRLQLEKVGGDDCQAYLNGTAVGEEQLTVAANEPYYMTLECGTTAAPVWHLKLAKGEKATVPVSGADPLRYTMENGNYRNRKVAESYMRLISYWSGISRVLGVKQHSSGSNQGSGEEGVLVVRVDGNGKAKWSDTQKSDQIRRAITRVMPEYEASSSGIAQSSTGRRDTSGARWLDWALLGVGVASLGGGTVLAIVTERRAKQVRCSPDTRTNPSNCEGVTVLQFENDQEVQLAEREVTMARAGYWSAFAAGAGFATWGIIRLATRDRASRTASTASPSNTRFTLVPTPTGASAQLQIRW